MTQNSQTKTPLTITMNTLPRYSTQFDKITVAYIEGKINPCDADFCFCGTLSPTMGAWRGNHNLFSWGEEKPEYRVHKYDHYQPYTISEYKRMEWALINGKNGAFTDDKEQDLFIGMCAALEVLKQIHLERGEKIDETPSFQKRNLQAV